MPPTLGGCGQAQISQFVVWRGSTVRRAVNTRLSAVIFAEVGSFSHVCVHMDARSNHARVWLKASTVRVFAVAALRRRLRVRFTSAHAFAHSFPFSSQASPTPLPMHHHNFLLHLGSPVDLQVV